MHMNNTELERHVLVEQAAYLLMQLPAWLDTQSSLVYFSTRSLGSRFHKYLLVDVSPALLWRSSM